MDNMIWEEWCSDLTDFTLVISPTSVSYYSYAEKTVNIFFSGIENRASVELNTFLKLTLWKVCIYKNIFLQNHFVHIKNSAVGL